MSTKEPTKAELQSQVSELIRDISVSDQSRRRAEQEAEDHRRDAVEANQKLEESSRRTRHFHSELIAAINAHIQVKYPEWHAQHSSAPEEYRMLCHLLDRLRQEIPYNFQGTETGRILGGGSFEELRY